MFYAVGGGDFESAHKEAVGRSGGLAVLWRKGCFELISEFQGNNFLGLEGFWGKKRHKVTLINIYAPCDLRGKKLLWEDILAKMEDRGSERWCILGDFNSIRCPGERKGVEGFDRSVEMNMFDDFISEAGLLDLPLIGRKFTWYKADGLAMSRLDRFLISEEWLNTWNNLTQWGRGGV